MELNHPSVLQKLWCRNSSTISALSENRFSAVIGQCRITDQPLSSINTRIDGDFSVKMEAAEYVTETYGIPCSPKTLAKLACVSSDGPPFRCRAFPAVPDLGPRCLGALENWAAGSFNVRSPDRRLTPENENPAARFLARGSASTPG
jgi:hypothetical protein